MVVILYFFKNQNFLKKKINYQIAKYGRKVYFNHPVYLALITYLYLSIKKKTHRHIALKLNLIFTNVYIIIDDDGGGGCMNDLFLGIKNFWFFLFI